MFIFLPNRCFTLCQTQWKLKSKSGLKYTKCYDSTGSILIGLKDGNNSIFVMFNVSENKENLLLVPRSTLKKTSKVTRHFTLSTQESSVWAFHPNSGANKNTSNLPAACIFFLFLQQASTCQSWFWTKTNMLRESRAFTAERWPRSGTWRCR